MDVLIYTLHRCNCLSRLAFCSYAAPRMAQHKLCQSELYAPWPPFHPAHLAALAKVS